MLAHPQLTMWDYSQYSAGGPAVAWGPSLRPLLVSRRAAGWQALLLGLLGGREGKAGEEEGERGEEERLGGREVK